MYPISFVTVHGVVASFQAFRGSQDRRNLQFRVCYPESAVLQPAKHAVNSYISFAIPKADSIDFAYPNLLRKYSPKQHEFDGQHYWEIGAKGYEFDRVKHQLEQAGNSTLKKHYRLKEFSYHHFCIFDKS